jgi:dTDP-4-amino-4,6-dideoxygalactose transaminase
VEDTLKRFPAGQIKVIIAVHLYGHPVDMKSIMAIAKRHSVAVIEDCAQAHGASIGSHKVGSIGACGAFSFYPTKNLGGFGDGGAIATSDESIKNRLRLLQQYGWRERYISDETGYNSRLDELQAAILDYKLPWLDKWNARREEIARLYSKGFEGLPLILPAPRPAGYHVYHQYVIRSSERDDLRAHLEKKGIRTAILYPMPIHRQPGYLNRVKIGEGGMSVTDKIVYEIMSLPIYPELKDIEVEYIIDAVQSYFIQK